MPNRSTERSDDDPNLFSIPGAKSPGAKNKERTDWISAHCDGGARGNPGPAGYGAQIRDASGAVIAELSEFLGVRTNNYAEYSGLLGCLAWALEHGHRRLRLVSDSELMVKQIQGKYQVKSPDLKPLYDEARRRVAKLEGFEISHALRHKNKDADRLANEAMDAGMNRRTNGSATAQAAQNSEAAPAAAARASPLDATERAAATVAPADAMLRGFTRDGVVHVLGGAKLPDGVFVKIIRE